MKIKVSASYSGKLPTGDYANANPFFMAEVEYETEAVGEQAEKEIDTNQQRLHAICYRNFKIVAERSHIEKLKNDMKGFRFYQTENGDYPSVTTILTPEFKAWIGDEELKIATSEGNIAHARAAHYISTGEWVDPKKLEGVANDLMVCRGRVLEMWNFPALIEKYPIKEMKNGRVLYNHTEKYAGTNDAECLYPLMGAKDGDYVPTIIDFKRTADRDKNFSQMAAYSKCQGMEHIKQMMIIETNIDNQQGFSKPITSSSIDRYFEVFQHKRAEFRKTYGV